MTLPLRHRVSILVVGVLGATVAGALVAAQPVAGGADAVEMLQREARAVRPLVESDLARDFLDATADLPRPGTRTIYFNRQTRQALTESEALQQDLERVKRDGFEKTELSERFYYYTRYGTPIAYARAIDLAARHGVADLDGRKVFDFGYGGIGHLRLLASLGAHSVGVDVDPVLDALYNAEPSDTGVVSRARVAGPGSNGSLVVLDGRFPKDRAITQRVGEGHALVLSKNVLKLGYIHPEREPASPNSLIDLGVDDDTFLRAMRDALAPGGVFVIYNLYPRQAGPDEPYKPWADGRSPFTKDQFERAGFDVLEFNRDDTDTARAMGERLGWRGQMNFEEDLFAMFTIVRRRE
jgi:hypothetical protein